MVLLLEADHPQGSGAYPGPNSIALVRRVVSQRGSAILPLPNTLTLALPSVLAAAPA